MARRLIPLLILLLLPQTVRPQAAEAVARSLAEQERWEELLHRFPDNPAAPAEVDLYRGIALARMGRFAEARAALARGATRLPGDPRFAIELAGVAYRQDERGDAKALLRQALAFEPGDDYANDFLATIYFLEGNLEAALKYWNRVGKPQLADLTYDPVPQVRPVLLDRAFRFSLGQQWTVGDYLGTRARIDHLGIFRSETYDLAARPDGRFDLTFHALEAPGWRIGYLAAGVMVARGLPFETVRIQFTNLGRAAINWSAVARWDAQKRRAFTELSAPLGNNPSWRLRGYLDARNENWDVSRTLFTAAAPVAGVNLQKIEAGVEISAVVNGRWSWSSSAGYSYRRYRDAAGLPAGAAALVEDGSEIHTSAKLRHSLWRLPERRLMVDVDVTGRLGRYFAPSLGAYGQLGGGVRLVWRPGAQGNRHEISSVLRGVHTLGDISFDQLSSLGFDRDHDVWLRGHSATREGRKGDAPLGTDYVLWNVDYLQRVYQYSFLTVRAGPFLDAGRAWDHSGQFGSAEWLWDVGGQVRVGVFGGMEVIFAYGHDIRTGRNVWLADTTR